jgi:hypothetical protein
MNQKTEGFTMTGNRGGALMKLLLFLIIFGGVITAAWIYFLPAILTSTLQKRTGFGVKVTELRFNPFNGKVDLTGFVITNPEGFPRPDFIEVSSFNANAKMKTLFSDRPEFDYAMIDVAYVAFVRDADGVLNAKLFNDRMNPPLPAPADENAETVKAAKANQVTLDAKVTKGGPVSLKPKPEAKPVEKTVKPASANKDAAVAKDTATPEQPVAKPTRFLIRRLDVRLDKVIVADYTTATPKVQEFDRKVYYTFNNISDPKQLLAPFALKSLESVGAAIRGLIPGEIGKAVGAVTKADEDKSVKKSGDPVEDPLKTIVEKLEETPKP